MFKKAIVWGWKLANHTRHYIHLGYFKAFREMGYDTLWLDNNDNISGMSFDNCLFFTEGRVDRNIPISQSSKYILHYCNIAKYHNVPETNIIHLRFYSSKVFEQDSHKINDYTYTQRGTIYQPWATDLLPREFGEVDIHNEKTNRECIWVGSYNQDDHTTYQNHTELDPFFNECHQNNISVKIINPWKKAVSPDENRKLIKEAFLAPAINGFHQKSVQYIPCRIFKNISYGHLGITNNIHVNSIFDNRLVYDDNPRILFQKALDKKNDPRLLEEMKFLINEVKIKHTFINRVNAILEALT